MAPKDENELKNMLWTAVEYGNGPVALRYPRGAGVGVPLSRRVSILPIGVSETMRRGKDVALLAVGPLVYKCLEVADILAQEEISTEVVNVRFVKPLDGRMLQRVGKKFSHLVTVEDNSIVGGFGSAVAEFLADKELSGTKLLRLGLPDRFIPHGKTNLLYQQLGLDTIGIARSVLRTLGKPGTAVGMPETAHAKFAEAAHQIAG
jgi:1-deoxy-D-xylulose-5-phosphate synthase